MVTLALIGLLGGLITGVSPCVLPMLPIIFFAGAASPAVVSLATAVPAGSVPVGAPPAPAEPAEPVEDEPKPSARTKRDFRPLKIIAGLVTSFSIFTLTGSAILSALGLPDGILRGAGLVVLGAVGIGLLVPAIGHLIERPFYRLPKIVRPADGGAFVLGLGLGTLYVPCAGPILAAITVAGATGRIGLDTVVLTVAFAAGAAAPLLVFASAGAKIRQRIAGYRKRARGFRAASGVVMVGLAIALAFNATEAIQRIIPSYTNGLQQRVESSQVVQGALTGLTNNQNSALSRCTPGEDHLQTCGKAPSLEGISRWFNTPGDKPVSLASLRGKVVLVDFWAYSCINCQRAIPHVVAWYNRYKADGLVVIGVHSPEFAFEKDTGNVASAVAAEHIDYPVAVDNSLETFTNYRNQYWPADYLIGPSGTVRHIQFGEGGYTDTETMIRSLLTQANPDVRLPPRTAYAGAAAPGAGTTPETYVDYSRASDYSGSPRLSLSSRPVRYRATEPQPPNTFGLRGLWSVRAQGSTPSSGAQLVLDCDAAKVYTVLGGSGTIDVSVAGESDRTIHVSGMPRLYTLVSSGTMQRRTLTLTYHGPIHVYTFSFG